MISGERLKNFVESFSCEKELVLTGSVPEQWMIDAADYVTDMEKIKHPFDKGINAREGVEY
jgi:cob(I)alamin adenosyltransferase